MLERAELKIGNKVCFIDCNKSPRVRAGTITNIIKDRLWIDNKEYFHIDFNGIYSMAMLPKLLKGMQIINTKNRGKEPVTYILDTPN